MKIRKKRRPVRRRKKKNAAFPMLQNHFTRKEARKMMISAKNYLRMARSSKQKVLKIWHAGRASGVADSMMNLVVGSYDRRFFLDIAKHSRKILDRSMDTAFPISKKNPARVGKETLIYSRFLPFTMYAVKGKNSHYPGGKFYHRFGNGGRIVGLPDGSIKLYPRKTSKPLWRLITQR